MKYPKPKLFNPTNEQINNALNQVAKNLSPDKIIIGSNGKKVRGTKIKSK